MKFVKRFFKSLRWKRFVAKYVRYLELWGYCNVIAVGVGVVAAWVVQVDVTAESKEGALVPCESPVRVGRDCVVLRFAVPDRTEVRKGDAVAEVTTDPDLVAGFRALAELRKALAVLGKAGGNGTLAAERAQLKAAVASRAGALENIPADKRVRLSAPCDGMLWRGDRRPLDFVPAGKNVAGVKDFDRLKVSLTFEKRNAELCRPGYRATVKIQPKQDFETLVRLDTDTSPIPFHGLRQDRFSNLEGVKGVRPLLVRTLKGRGLLDADVKSEHDYPLPATGIGGITLLVGGGAEDGGGTGDAGLTPENFRGEELAGVVVDGKHLADYKIMGLEGELQQEVEGILREALEEKSIRRPDARYTVKKLSRITVNLSASGEMAMGRWDLAKRPGGVSPGEIPSTTEEFRRGEGSGNVKLGKRRFVGTVRLLNPPEGLRSLVRRLTLQGHTLKVKGEVIVDTTRFAMRLFRKR